MGCCRACNRWRHCLAAGVGILLAPHDALAMVLSTIPQDASLLQEPPAFRRHGVCCVCVCVCVCVVYVFCVCSLCVPGLCGVCVRAGARGTSESANAKLRMLYTISYAVIMQTA